MKLVLDPKFLGHGNNIAQKTKIAKTVDEKEVCGLVNKNYRLWSECVWPAP